MCGGRRAREEQPLSRRAIAVAGRKRARGRGEEEAAGSRNRWNGGPSGARRGLGGGDGTQSATALGVAVELGHDDGADRDGVVEGLRLVVYGLADRGVHHEDHLGKPT